MDSVAKTPQAIQLKITAWKAERVYNNHTKYQPNRSNQKKDTSVTSHRTSGSPVSVRPQTTTRDVRGIAPTTLGTSVGDRKYLGSDSSVSSPVADNRKRPYSDGALSINNITALYACHLGARVPISRPLLGHGTLAPRTLFHANVKHNSGERALGTFGSSASAAGMRRLGKCRLTLGSLATPARVDASLDANLRYS